MAADLTTPLEIRRCAPTGVQGTPFLVRGLAMMWREMTR